MTKKQTQEAHNAPLKYIFEDGNYDYAETNAGLAGRLIMNKSHSRFRAWLLLCFGDKQKTDKW